ncbi:HNH endonuclease [Sphingopyxis sp. 550A]
MGGGRFCSQQCNTSIATANKDPEFQRRAAEACRKARAEGRISYPTGKDSLHWKGGIKATLERRRVNGKAAASIRAYRANNPDKVREFASRRKGRKVGRLPRGTIARIGESQRWRCGICRVSIRKKFDVDHIQPLARGGRHEPRNIQLLCHTCNIRKSARDPIVHMRSLGRLL